MRVWVGLPWAGLGLGRNRLPASRAWMLAAELLVGGTSKQGKKGKRAEKSRERAGTHCHGP